MNNRSYALRAGIFVAVFGAAIFAAALWIGGEHAKRVPYIVVTQGNVFGLKAESTVFFRGIDAGIVRRIAVDPRDPRAIDITILIAKRIPITRGTYAELRLQGVTGLSALELNTTNDLAPLPTSRAHPARIPMRPSLLNRLASAGRVALHGFKGITAALNKTLDRTNRRHLSALLARTDRAARALPGLMAHADKTLRNITRLTNETRLLGRRVRTLVATGQSAGNIVVTRTLPRLDRAIDRLAAAARAVKRLSRSLHHHPRELLLGARPLPPGPGEPGSGR